MAKRSDIDDTHFSTCGASRRLWRDILDLYEGGNKLKQQKHVQTGDGTFESYFYSPYYSGFVAHAEKRMEEIKNKQL